MNREYEHVATEDTLNALRHLRGPWRGWSATPEVIRVQTADGVVVRLTPDSCSPEPGFAVRRIAGEFERGATRPPPAVAGFERGGHEVVIFRGESWLTALADPGRPIGAPVDADDDAHFDPASAWLVTHGVPGQRPEAAAAACTTTDAVLVATGTGAGWLVRLCPEGLEVVTDRRAIGEFLTARGYAPL
jgi:hypothetical protein